MVDGDDDFEFSVPDELMKKDPPQSEDPVLRIFQAANNAASLLCPDRASIPQRRESRTCAVYRVRSSG